MFKKIQQITATVLSIIALSVPMMVPVAVHAAQVKDTEVGAGLCTGLDAATGTTTSCDQTSADATTSISTIVKTIINIFSIIVGAVSVIMIIYGGFKYITSGGNESNVGSAKNTILYALIGLIIVALAQVIVRFVLSKAVNAA